MSLLTVDGVTRRYHLPREKLFAPAPVLTAVDRASFTLEAGKTLGIVGESGSGKSTLARMVMAFEAPDEGKITFKGQDLNAISGAELRALRPQFQIIFQDPYGSLDPRRTAGWSIAEPLRAIRDTADASARVTRALEQVGLRAEDAHKYPHEFSGGQRQRLAIARAIITRPHMIVADEAVSALDVSVQAQILNLLMDLQDELGLAMLFISHDLSVVSAICDEVLVLEHGKTVEHGPSEQVMHAPSHPYTRSLLTAAGL